jgi:hypothetical protein
VNRYGAEYLRMEVVMRGVVSHNSEQLRILHDSDVVLYSFGSELWNRYWYRSELMVMGHPNGCVIIPAGGQSHHGVYSAWYVKRNRTTGVLVLIVFEYNSTKRGEIEGEAVVRKFFTSKWGCALLRTGASFIVTLPATHGHSMRRYEGRVLADGDIEWMEKASSNRTLRVPEDLPSYDPVDKLPITVDVVSGYTIRETDEGTYIRVDSAARAQWGAEVFIKREDYPRVAVYIGCPRTLVGDDWAGVDSSDLPVLHEFSDRHGCRLLIVSPRDNRIVVRGPNPLHAQREPRRAVLTVYPDGTIQRD